MEGFQSWMSSRKRDNVFFKGLYEVLFLALLSILLVHTCDQMLQRYNLVECWHVDVLLRRDRPHDCILSLSLSICSDVDQVSDGWRKQV